MRTGICIAVIALMFARPVQAQEGQAAPTLCKAEPCGLLIDWGTEGTPVIDDRRYGPPSQFAAQLIEQLKAAGYGFTEDLSKVKVTAKVRPRLVKAMCDVVPGTGSGLDCTAIGEVRVEFQSSGAGVPKDLRVLSRCGEGEYMTVRRFSQYVAEMLDRTLSTEKKSRPSSKC